MTKFLIGGTVAALAVAIAPALAQPAPTTPPGVAPGTAVAPVAPVRPTPEMRSRVRVMYDHEMTRDEAVKHVREMFAKLDLNHDNIVTREEVDAFHQKMMGAMSMGGDMEKRLGDHGIMMGDRNQIFDRLDANHDGSISRQEFTSAQPQVRQERVMIIRNGPDGASPAPGEPGGMDGMRMRMQGGGMGRGFEGRLFDIADANHDGRLTLQEAEAAALAHFDKADLNHDGKITPEERAQAHALRRARKPG